MIHYNSRGTRFHAAGFGPATDGLRVDCYDNPGDYLGSGIDGLEAYVHGNAQDQIGQITKRGKIVIYGDVGQTFLYGAKGGEVYVLGNAAGRPMINAVGRRAWSSTARPWTSWPSRSWPAIRCEGGGFAIVNGLRFDDFGNVVPWKCPIRAAISSRWPPAGRSTSATRIARWSTSSSTAGPTGRCGAADWKLILPYLEENQRLFGIRIDRDLLTVDGVQRSPAQVYRKVMPKKGRRGRGGNGMDEVGE